MVLAACDLLAEALEISRSKIIVSTVGLADAMRAFLATRKAKLALSLHATTDAVRDWIVPTNRRHPIGELVQVLEQHFPLDKKGPRGDDFVVIEYVLLRGVNDTVEDARRLVQLTANVYCMVRDHVAAERARRMHAAAPHTDQRPPAPRRSTSSCSTRTTGRPLSAAPTKR